MVWAVGNSAQNVALKELIESQASDRVVAIVGAAILEDSLLTVLVSRLRPSEPGHLDVNEKLFKMNGPLGSLVPKIDIAYQLYAFDKSYRNAMYGIAEIRNLFAHRLDVTFAADDPTMKKAADKLALHEGRTYYPDPFTEKESNEFPIVEPTDTTRDKFFVNLKLCLLWLMGDRHRHIPWSNAPPVGGMEHFQEMFKE
jgi:hypothetical protein